MLTQVIRVHLDLNFILDRSNISIVLPKIKVKTFLSL